MSARGAHSAAGPGDDAGTTGGLSHPALGPARGVPLAAARLGDRQRVAVLLQAAALLAHLRRAGRRLRGGLIDGWVRDGEVLCGLTVETGVADEARTALGGLLAALFDASGTVGRGDGRRAARELRERWRAELVPLAPEQAVADVLTAAPFLWQARFGPARCALVAHCQAAGGPQVWIAAPEPARRALLGAAGGAEAVEALLAGAAAASAWTAAAGEAPPDGRTGAPPPTPLDEARGLFAHARFKDALERVAGEATPPARLLAAWCAWHLGREGAARRALALLARESLGGDLDLSLAELGVRACLAAGEAEGAATWVARARRAARGEGAWRAELLAAEAAWGLGQGDQLPGLLAAAAPAAGHPATAWRWLRLRAHAAAEGERAEVLAAMVESLRRCRRGLAAADAAQLWDDVAAVRLAAGDLAGAERAAAHAARLLRRGEAPRQERRALRRLIEVRVRRGRLGGVEEALPRAHTEDRLATDGGPAEVAALLARLELVRGRGRSALAACEAALAELRPEQKEEARVLAVLAARALGWLGRPSEASRRLCEAGRIDGVLEREEGPALWAHAGDRAQALLAAASAPLRHLWEAVLAGAHPARGRWNDLESLEPWRAARLVFDFELLTPGLVPVAWVRRAIATLRRLSAEELATRLEGGLAGPWEALYAHLAESTHDEDGLQRLFAAAGAEQVWVAVRGRHGEQVLLAGPGGDEVLEAPLGDGHLVLRAPRLDAVVKTLFRLLLRQLPAVRAAAAGQPVPGLVGESPALLAALARLPLLAQGEVPVMVLGESGTGKEVVARQVHRLSPRSGGPFLPINCAALSESLLLSDLFGHARGAFTGADRDHAGIFETARGGTVFLDEIGDLPLAAQGKLLRVLQEKEVRRVGESSPRRVDVRVVTATHRDLAAMLRDGSFREDLFYRLRVAVVELPPLRERGGDVLLLAEHFLARGSRGRRPARLSRAARARLLAHPWPGNVRELENVLEVAAALAAGGAIEPDHLPLAGERSAPEGTYHQRVEAFRRRLVEEALVGAHGNRAEAARRLGLTRQALSYLVRQLGIGGPKG